MNQWSPDSYGGGAHRVPGPVLPDSPGGGQHHTRQQITLSLPRSSAAEDFLPLLSEVWAAIDAARDRS